MAELNLIKIDGDVSKLSEPANTLILKISDAIGALYQPIHIRRIAKAEADAQITKVMGEIEITELQRRAINRFVGEQTKKQVNIESVATKSLPDVENTAQPEKIDNDWLTNFFDKCSSISDQQMQDLWAKVLAGEANSPGSFSKHTISILSSLDKSDAESFRRFCSFVWTFDFPLLPQSVPIVPKPQPKMRVEDKNITSSELFHLQTLGLVNYSVSEPFGLYDPIETFSGKYFGRQVTFYRSAAHHVLVGHARFTKAGLELSKLSGAEPCDSALNMGLVMFRRDGWQFTFNGEQSISK